MRVTIEQQPISLARWAVRLNLTVGTLERWYYACGMTAPASSSNIRCALFYARERCDKARGATRDRALQNLEKINLALEITENVTTCD